MPRIVWLVASKINFTHPARTKLALNFVTAQSCTAGQGHKYDLQNYALWSKAALRRTSYSISVTHTALGLLTFSHDANVCRRRRQTLDGFLVSIISCHGISLKIRPDESERYGPIAGVSEQRSFKMSTFTASFSPDPPVQ